MPVHDYRCNDCGHVFSVMVSIKVRDSIKCPRCGSRSLKQAFSIISKAKRPIPSRCG